MIIEIETLDEFENLIQNDKAVLIDFYATWCGPCRSMAPVLESLAEDDYIIGKIDVDNDELSDVVVELGIMSVPTFAVFKNGEVIDLHTGTASKEALIRMLS